MGADSAITLDGQSRVAIGIIYYYLRLAETRLPARQAKAQAPRRFSPSKSLRSPHVLNWKPRSTLSALAMCLS
jgi:hypothetical protein